MPNSDSTIIYKDIPDAPGYKVGNDGSVWTNRVRGGRGKIGPWWELKQCADTKGYCLVSLHNKDGQSTFRIHLLVLRAFVGSCPLGMQACHNDGNPANNALSNLRWDTPRANQADRIRHGTDRRGGRNGMAKLTDESVRRIREMDAAGVRRRDVAAMFGVTKEAISYICRRKFWRHVV